MRIIAGRFKGHRLSAFKAGHIRPTTDRVKESIFNRVQSLVPDAKVLDLFSGTGSLGLEALSRGAQSVQFVDSHPKSIQILNQNIDKLAVRDSVAITNTDVFRFLKSADEKYDLIFIDPPFTKKIADKVMQAVSEAAISAEDGLVLIEASHQEVINDAYLPLELLDRKDFGDKSLSIFTPTQQRFQEP